MGVFVFSLARKNDVGMSFFAPPKDVAGVAMTFWGAKNTVEAAARTFRGTKNTVEAAARTFQGAKNVMEAAGTTLPGAKNPVEAAEMTFREPRNTVEAAATTFREQKIPWKQQGRLSEEQKMPWKQRGRLFGEQKLSCVEPENPPTQSLKRFIAQRRAVNGPGGALQNLALVNHDQRLWQMSTRIGVLRGGDSWPASSSGCRVLGSRYSAVIRSLSKRGE